MFIPYGTDAPLYHRPLGTIGLIVANVLVFVHQIFNPFFTDSYKLIYGEFHPVQWVTSAFMHGGIQHLVGNMIFLWIFGIVVEGKVGTSKFIMIFMFLAVLQNAIEQTLSVMFPPDQIAMLICQFYGVRMGSLGASSAIFGLMVISMLWAPENEIYFKFLFSYHVISDFGVSILALGSIFVLLDFWSLWMSYFDWGSPFLHLMGGAVGGGVGYWMLKTRQVDCEGFDLITIRQGRRGQATPTVEQEDQQKLEEEQRKLKLKQDREHGMQRVRFYIEQGHFQMAINRFKILRRSHNVQMPESWKIEIIQGLLKSDETREAAIPMMEDYVRNHSQYRISIGLNLARLYLDLHQRHRSAYALAMHFKKENLDPNQRRFLSGILVDCQKMVDDGVVDLRSGE